MAWTRSSPETLSARCAAWHAPAAGTDHVCAARAQVAQGCLEKAKDLAGLLLLHSATGSGQGMAALQQAASSEGKHNVEFLAAFLLGQVGACVDILIASGRLPEAAFFARTYLPSRTSEARHLLPLCLLALKGSADHLRWEVVSKTLCMPLIVTQLRPTVASTVQCVLGPQQPGSVSQPAGAFSGSCSTP